MMVGWFVAVPLRWARWTTREPWGEYLSQKIIRLIHRHRRRHSRRVDVGGQCCRRERIFPWKLSPISLSLSALSATSVCVGSILWCPHLSIVMYIAVRAIYGDYYWIRCDLYTWRKLQVMCMMRPDNGIRKHTPKDIFNDQNEKWMQCGSLWTGSGRTPASDQGQKIESVEEELFVWVISMQTLRRYDKIHNFRFDELESYIICLVIAFPTHRNAHLMTSIRSHYVMKHTGNNCTQRTIKAKKETQTAERANRPNR